MLHAISNACNELHVVCSNRTNTNTVNLGWYTLRTYTRGYYIIYTVLFVYMYGDHDSCIKHDMFKPGVCLFCRNGKLPPFQARSPYFKHTKTKHNNAIKNSSHTRTRICTPIRLYNVFLLCCVIMNSYILRKV